MLKLEINALKLNKKDNTFTNVALTEYVASVKGQNAKVNELKEQGIIVTNVNAIELIADKSSVEIALTEVLQDSDLVNFAMSYLDKACLFRKAFDNMKKSK